MKIFTLFLFITLLSCNNSNEIPDNQEPARVDTQTLSNAPKEADLESQPVRVVEENHFFKNKTLTSGTAHRMIFSNKNKIKIELDRFYDGSEKTYSITGKYEYIDGKLKVTWNKTNTISWLNTWGECGLQTVRQSHSFSNILDITNSSNCIRVNTKFKQSFYEGQRCGNEDKDQDDFFEFCL